MANKRFSVQGDLLMAEKLWERTQKNTFTKWCNMHLGKRGRKIEEIQNDFGDGILLIQLLEIIGGEEIGKYNKNPTLRIHKIENVNKALDYIRKKNVKLHGISAEEITENNLKLILGMIWTVILRFAIADISEEELSAKEALLLWCKKKTTGYAGVHVENFTTSWKDGLALNALIHAHRPDLIPYDTLSAADPRGNLKLAMDVAEKELGIPPLIDIDDIVDVPKPDERSVMTYIAQFYHYFAQNRKQEVAGRRIGKLVDMNKTMEELKADYNVKSGEHLAWVKKTTGELSDLQLDNTLEGVIKLIGDLNNFKSVDKPPKISERLNIETLHNAIQIKLNAANRPAYVPPEGQSIADIGNAWTDLEKAQQAREDALLAELARQQKLDLLKRKFYIKAAQLEEWIQQKEEFLKSPDNVDSIGAAQTQLKNLEAFLDEYEKAKSRLQSLLGIRDEIVSEKDKDSNVINDRAEKIKSDFENLKVLAGNRQAELEAKQKDQEDKEDLRKRFANAAKEYNYWVKENITQINGTVFPDSLEGVENLKATLDANDSEVSAANDQKKAHLDDLWNEEQAKGINDNKYTVFTNKDIANLHQQINDALSKRREEYQIELERQRLHEEKRKLFAKLAQEFVDELDARRNQISQIGSEGEPLATIDAIKSQYNNAKPETDRLVALNQLQDELGKMGVSDNKYTKYTIPILKVYLNSQLVRYVRNLIKSLSEEDALKQKYNAEAQELSNWISETTPTIGGNFDNTLEGVRATKRNWNEYKTTVKAERAISKINVENLFKKIASTQESNKRPAFTPALTVESINENWNKLEEVCKARDAAIGDELARQEKIYFLVKAFNSEAEELENWIEDQKKNLSVSEEISTLDQARIKITHLDVADEDSVSKEQRLGRVREQKDEIVSLNYAKSNEVTARLAALESNWGALKQLSVDKRAKLEQSRSVQQSNEDLRISFADKAEDFLKFVRDAVAHLDDINFGTSLEDVENFKEKLQSEDEAYISTMHEKRSSLQEVVEELANRNINDNRHTKLTTEDIENGDNQLSEAMVKRRNAYIAALGQETEHDELKRAFAAKAEAFVNFVQKQRTEIKAAANAEAPLDQRSENVKAIHKEGKPNRELLDELVNLTKNLHARGVFSNQYTPHTVPSLEKLNKSFNDSVENVLQNIAEDKEIEQREHAQNEERKLKEALEQERLEFEKQSQTVVISLETLNESFTEPINVDTVEAVNKLTEQYDANRAALNSKQADIDSLTQHAGQLKAKGVEVSIDNVSSKYGEVQKNADTLKENLASELNRQVSHDNLRKDFAEKANKLSEYLNAVTAKAANSQGSLEAQLALLNEINMAEGKALFDVVSKVGDSLANENITAIRYTEHNIPNLKARLDETGASINAKRSLIEKEILSQKQSVASPKQIEEFKEVFKHFDKNGTNKLSKLEFKSCLQSLGEDPTDDEMEKLLSTIGTKQEGEEKLAVEFDAFVEYMIKVTSDTTTQHEIVQAFRDLAQDKDFVTKVDLQRGGMSEERINYLISNMPAYPGVEGGFDYNAWAASAFN